MPKKRGHLAHETVTWLKAQINDLCEGKKNTEDPLLRLLDRADFKEVVAEDIDRIYHELEQAAHAPKADEDLKHCAIIYLAYEYGRNNLTRWQRVLISARVVDAAEACWGANVPPPPPPLPPKTRTSRSSSRSSLRHMASLTKLTQLTKRQSDRAGRTTEDLLRDARRW